MRRRSFSGPLSAVWRFLERADGACTPPPPFSWQPVHAVCLAWEASRTEPLGTCLSWSCDGWVRAARRRSEQQWWTQALCRRRSPGRASVPASLLRLLLSLSSAPTAGSSGGGSGFASAGFGNHVFWGKNLHTKSAFLKFECNCN